jgi:hypothetical protein
MTGRVQKSTPASDTTISTTTTSWDQYLGPQGEKSEDAGKLPVGAIGCNKNSCGGISTSSAQNTPRPTIFVPEDPPSRPSSGWRQYREPSIGPTSGGKGSIKHSCEDGRRPLKPASPHDGGNSPNDSPRPPAKDPLEEVERHGSSNWRQYRKMDEDDSSRVGSRIGTFRVTSTTSEDQNDGALFRDKIVNSQIQLSVKQCSPDGATDRPNSPVLNTRTFLQPGTPLLGSPLLGMSPLGAERPNSPLGIGRGLSPRKQNFRQNRQPQPPQDQQ